MPKANLSSYYDYTTVARNLIGLFFAAKITLWEAYFGQ